MSRSPDATMFVCRLTLSLPATPSTDTDASINDQTANMLQRAGHELVCLVPEWSPSPDCAWSFAEDLMRILRVS